MRKTIHAIGLVLVVIITFLGAHWHGTTGKQNQYILHEKLDLPFSITNEAQAAGILCDVCTSNIGSFVQDCVANCAQKYGQQEIYVNGRSVLLASVCAEGCVSLNNLMANKCRGKYLSFN